jgi:hypothetical protein
VITPFLGPLTWRAKKGVTTILMLKELFPKNGDGDHLYDLLRANLT